VTIPAARAHEVIAMNRRGEKPVALDSREVQVAIGYETGHGDVTRFDRKKKKNHHPNKR
jgi:hypothetical protein